MSAKNKNSDSLKGKIIFGDFGSVRIIKIKILFAKRLPSIYKSLIVYNQSTEFYTPKVQPTHHRLHNRRQHLPLPCR